MSKGQKNNSDFTELSLYGIQLKKDLIKKFWFGVRGKLVGENLDKRKSQLHT